MVKFLRKGRKGRGFEANVKSSIKKDTTSLKIMMSSLVLPIHLYVFFFDPSFITLSIIGI